MRKVRIVEIDGNKFDTDSLIKLSNNIVTDSGSNGDMCWQHSGTYLADLISQVRTCFVPFSIDRDKLAEGLATWDHHEKVAVGDFEDYKGAWYLLKHKTNEKAPYEK